MRKLLLALLSVCLTASVSAQQSFSTKQWQSLQKSFTNNNEFGIPRFATASLPTCSVGLNLGAIAYDTTDNTAKVCNAAGSWSSTPFGGGLAIGSAVTGGGANAVLFEDASQNLGADPTNFFWQTTANGNYLRIGAGTSPGAVRLLEGSGSGTNYGALTVPTTLGGDRTYTLPDSSINVAGSVAALTVNVLPKGTSTSGVIADSSITDTGSLISFTNDFSATGQLLWNVATAGDGARIATASDTTPTTLTTWDARHSCPALSGTTNTSSGVCFSYDQTGNTAYMSTMSPGVAVRPFIWQGTTFSFFPHNGSAFQGVATFRSSGGPVLALNNGATAIGIFSVADNSVDVGGWRDGGALNAFGDVEAVTVTKTTTLAESNETYTNTGDADGATITLLNDPTAGAVWHFAVTAAQTLTIVPSTGESLKLGGTTCATDLHSNTVGSTVTIRAVTGGSGAAYYSYGAEGTWVCS